MSHGDAKILVHGVSGRMGRAIVRVIEETPGATLAAAIAREGSSCLGVDAGVLSGVKPLGVLVTDDLEGALASGVDVVIDFSLPEGTDRVIAACAEKRIAVVVGTTGLPEDTRSRLSQLASEVPVVFAPNMSVGVTALFHLAAKAASLLGADFDAEIVEMHHRNKVDAPSGTAVRLAEVVARAKGLDPDEHCVHGRSGQVGRRPKDEIGVMTLRGGDVVGEHTLLLAAMGERIELTHRATDRSIFARGAVRAAKWVVTRHPGLYDMPDVIGIPR